MAAGAGVIRLQAGTFNVTSTLILNRSVTIMADVVGDTVVLDGLGERRVITVDGGMVRLVGLSISKGSSPDHGGGVLVSAGNVSFEECIITGSMAKFGGGASVDGGDVTFDRCSIVGNTGYFYGGGVHIGQDAGNVTLYGCSSTNNTVLEGYGGGICIKGGDVMLDGCRINENIGGNPLGINWGGGCSVVGGTVTFMACSIDDNTSPYAMVGGGAYVYRGNVTFDGCSVSGNVAGLVAGASGGGIFMGGAHMTLRNCAIHGNTAKEGGGIFVYPPTCQYYVDGTCLIGATIGLLTLDGSTIRGNRAINGGAIYLTVTDGTSTTVVTLVSVNISQNLATEVGGGLYASGLSCVFLNTRVTANSAASGAGLYVLAGSVRLAGGSLAAENQLTNSTGAGSQLQIIGGAVSVALPVLPGHWLPNAECLVYRHACPLSDGKPEPACVNARHECSLSPIRDKHVLTDGGDCPESTFVQPCDWEGEPSLLGQRLFTVPLLPIDETYPYECAPGVVGSTDPEQQGSPLCGGLCPAGSLCPTSANLSPERCPPGSYCPLGSASPVSCPSQTYNSLAGQRNATACLTTPRSRLSAEGSCFFCDGSDFCSTYNDNLECQCITGFYLAEPVGLCKPCAQGVACAIAGTALATLEVQRGFWRTSSSSSNARSCPHDDTCKGGADAPLQYDPASTATCVEGRGLSGVYCSLCSNASAADGGAAYYFREDSRRCELCGERPLRLLAGLIGAFGGVVVACLIARYWLRTRHQGWWELQVDVSRRVWQRVARGRAGFKIVRAARRRPRHLSC